MKKELSPAAVWSIIAILVVGAAVAFWWFTTPHVKAETKTAATREEMEDPDPPKRGQPGYRERITDPPSS
jgi:flagellar basal body-associated protein FliL